MPSDGWSSPADGSTTSRALGASGRRFGRSIAVCRMRVLMPLVADSVLEHLDDPQAALRRMVARAPTGREPAGLVAESVSRSRSTPTSGSGAWAGSLGAWMPAYVRIRRAWRAWPPPCLSAGQARRLAREAGFASIEVEAPGIPEVWARSRPAWQRALIAAYGSAQTIPPTRSLLRAFGPLWQLRATRREAA